MCILVAVLIRVWLIVHTNGVIAGDEAMVGIQAEHILHGEHPIYYYGQPYMGSLQMYLIAGIFLITGPHVWAMRIEPMLISLLIVVLTWRFAEALANAARLIPRAKMRFVVIATLVAAFPPLYDAVEEMRTTGGYVEAFAIMLWLLLCAFRLTQRWSAGASARELALRWAGIGFLIGLGFWIDPLVAYALVTIALWIGGYVLVELVHPQDLTGVHPRLALLKKTLLLLIAIPASLIGFAPGLYWGLHHQWANVRYLFQKGGAVPTDRLHTIVQVQKVYTTCLLPRTLGGALPTQPTVTASHPQLVTVGLILSGFCLAISLVCVLLSFVWPHPLLVGMRQLTLLPLLFLSCASIIFCTASIAFYAIYSGCSSWDLVGRYAVPLVIALPFFIAAVFTLIATVVQERKKVPSQEQEENKNTIQYTPKQPSTRLIALGAMQAGLLIVLAIYFSAQGIAYAQANPRYTFQGTGCISRNPTDQSAIISYMQQTHIRYAWATGWLGDPITLKTDAALLVTELHGRIQTNSTTLLRADRPGIFLLVPQNDLHPSVARELDARHVTYHVERFYSEPGVDLLLITPLNRTVSPLDPAFTTLFQNVFKGCVTQ